MRNKPPNHVKGFVTEQHDFPMGRGRKGQFRIVKTGGERRSNSAVGKENYVDIVTKGGNPIHNLTHNKDTEQSSLTFYSKAGHYNHYAVLEEHDDETVLAYEIWKMLRMKMRERELSVSISSRNVGNLYTNCIQIPVMFRITKRMRKKIKAIEGKITKFHPLKRKPSGVGYGPPPERKASRTRKLVNYKDRKTVRKQ